MPTPFRADLVTPERVLFSGHVEEVSMRTDAGEIAFLAAHEDYVAAVDITVVRLSLVAGDTERGGRAPAAERPPGSGAPDGNATAARVLRAAVHGGFVQVDTEGVTILASVAELADEIDTDRARRALEAAHSSTPASDSATAASGPTSPSPAVLALLEPDAPDVRARRAQARLEAAGVT